MWGSVVRCFYATLKIPIWRQVGRVTLVQRSSVIFHFLLLLLSKSPEDEESHVVGRTCYCRLGNTYPFFLRKINWYLGFFQGRPHFKYCIVFPVNTLIWRDSPALIFGGQELRSLLCSELLWRWYLKASSKAILCPGDQEEEIFSPSIFLCIHSLPWGVFWVSLPHLEITSDKGVSFTQDDRESTQSIM